MLKYPGSKHATRVYRKQQGSADVPKAVSMGSTLRRQREGSTLSQSHRQWGTESCPAGIWELDIFFLSFINILNDVVGVNTVPQ